MEQFIQLRNEACMINEHEDYELRNSFRETFANKIFVRYLDNHRPSLYSQ